MGALSSINPQLNILLYSLQKCVDYDWNWNFWPELELAFVDLVLVEPELHQELQVPLTRTGTVRPIFRYKLESNSDSFANLLSVLYFGIN